MLNAYFQIRYLKYAGGGTEFPLIYDSSKKNTGIIFDGSISKNTRNIATISIEILSNSPYYNLFQTSKDNISITQYGQFPVVVFRGRLSNIEEVYGSEGKSKKLTFESIKACLNDGYIDGNFIPDSSDILDICQAISESNSYEYISKYGVSVVAQEGTGLSGLYPSEYADQLGKKHKEVIEDILKNTNYWIKENNSELATEIISYLSVEILYADYKPVNRLILGKHVNSLIISDDYSKIINHVTIQGDGVISTVQDASSISDHSIIRYYKKDDRYKIQASTDAYANEILSLYKNPINRAEVDYIDYDYLKENQYINTIDVGSIVDIVDKELNSIYKGYVVEVKYNLFEPYKKKLIVGNVKENLFKEGDI